MKNLIKKNRNIQQNLNDPAFVKMLQEHPIVQTKVERAKKDLALIKANKNSPVSE